MITQSSLYFKLFFKIYFLSTKTFSCGINKLMSISVTSFIMLSSILIENIFKYKKSKVV